MYSVSLQNGHQWGNCSNFWGKEMKVTHPRHLLFSFYSVFPIMHHFMSDLNSSDFVIFLSV